MAEVELIRVFLIAIALGALIGLEREYARYRKHGPVYAGIRTFPLISLFGALCAYFGDIISPWILVSGILLTGVLIIAAYFETAEKTRSVGATSEIAGFITFFIGVLSYYNEIKLASIIAIAMAVILYARSLLHNFARKMKRAELADTLKFAVVAFVILPFLPNKGYGPLEFFNPYTFWLLVVFMLGISFVGYIFMRWLGEKGITMTGLLGGIVSSTVVTTSFAHKSAKEAEHAKAFALGVILANGIMFLRVLVITSVLNQELFFIILPAFLLLTMITIIIAYILWRKIAAVNTKITLTSPFTLLPALKFSLIFALTSLLFKLGHAYFSSHGIYVVSFFSGLADVDAVTASAAQLMNLALSKETAFISIFIAALANIASKGIIAYWFGSREFSRIVAAAFAILITVGLALLFILRTMY